MTDTDWHAPPALLARFADDPGALDDMTASSIEAHLVVCADCRQQLTAAGDPAIAAASWAAIADRIDQPRPALIERLLRRLGVDSGFARLLGATPALQAAGLASVAVLVAGAAVLTRMTDAEGPFLVLAPLVPLAAVAASFAPAADPAGEAAMSTPLHGLGLVVRRAIAVLIVSFGLLAVAAVTLRDLGPDAAAWILPALALSLGSLALATWLRVETAVAVLAFGWGAVVFSVWWIEGHDAPVVASETFATAGQLVALALAAIALAVVAVRRDRFATLEVFS